MLIARGLVPVHRGSASGCEKVGGESALSLHNGATGAPRCTANTASQSDASPHRISLIWVPTPQGVSYIPR